MSEAPLVTVLIPARNEAADLPRCLDHVLAQDHPHDRLEVVVVDGGSSDGTGEVAAARLAASDLHRWVVHPNPTGTTPSNLNAGLTVVTGEILVRVDARSFVPPHHVRCCAEVLTERPDVAVTGGAQVAVAVSDDPVSVGIARALNNRWSMGFARYRRAARSGPADTVYLGAFRTAELREAGGWDERFATNQDFELNRRMGTRGLVWFDDRLEVGYRPRARLAQLASQYHRFGRWKARYWSITGDRPRPRQLVLLLAPLPATGVALAAFWRLPRLRLPAVGAALAAAAVIELRGPTGPPTIDPRAHAVGVAASAVVAGSWFAGAWSGVARWLLERGRGGRWSPAPGR
jgi:succinoglycan biosynthesis protein ExoA